MLLLNKRRWYRLAGTLNVGTSTAGKLAANGAIINYRAVRD